MAAPLPRTVSAAEKHTRLQNFISKLPFVVSFHQCACRWPAEIPPFREPEKQLDYSIVGASLYHRFGSPRNTSVAKGSDRSYSRMSHQQPCSGAFTSLPLDSLI